ncbi:MAG: NAD-dependent epimerase/dehydratase family protein [Anaerolineae bacterium]
MRILRRVTPDMAARIIADAVMVNLALASALLLRFMWLAATNQWGGAHAQELGTSVLHDSLLAYRDAAPLLSILSLSIFALRGFYTYGRAYRSRYKALVIVQAVTISHLTFTALHYLLSPLLPLPRLALLASWGLSLMLIGGMRIGAALMGETFWQDACILGRPASRPLRHILVIGGAGYIGSILVRRLLDRGYRVTVLDALVYGDEGIRELQGRAGFRLIRDDFRHIEAVVGAMQYADAVVHLGALVGDPACSLDEKLTIEINLAATRLIAETARGFGIQRFVFASTCSVYGASDEILDERSALNPVSLYARTKIGSERVLLAMSDNRFAPTVLRLATIYGLSPRPRFDLVVNVLAAQAAREKTITISGGDQWRPFIHVDDVAAAIVKCLESPLAVVKGQVFNIGCDEQNYRIADVGQLIHDMMPDVQVVQKAGERDPRNYRVSFAKARRCLGFEPRHTIIEGIQEIRSAIEQGLIVDYGASCYNNYKALCGDKALLLRRTRMSPLTEELEEPDVRLTPQPAATATS